MGTSSSSSNMATNIADSVGPVYIVGSDDCSLFVYWYGCGYGYENGHKFEIFIQRLGHRVQAAGAPSCIRSTRGRRDDGAWPSDPESIVLASPITCSSWLSASV